MTKNNKVDLQLFKAEFEVFQGAFNYSMTDAQVKIYFDVFSDWDAQEFRESCDCVLKTSNRFPTIAAIYKARVDGGFGKFSTAI